MTKTNKYIIPWDDNLNTGVTWIDEQHQQMLKHIETMLNAIIDKKCIETIDQSVAFLEKYVSSHFSAEQKYMLTHNYPNYTVHNMQHKSFAYRLKEMKLKYKQKGASRELALEIQKDLWEWYKTHICRMDKDFSIFLQKSKGDKQ